MSIAIPPDNEADYIEASEGRRYAAYDDATGAVVPEGGVCKGTLTNGVGHTGRDVFPGQIWSDAEVSARFAADRSTARSRAINDVGGDAWVTLDAVRQVALVDMAFELGEAGLGAFKALLAAVRDGAWDNAAAQCIASRYAAEVPRRARRNAHVLLTGEWPPAEMW